MPNTYCKIVFHVVFAVKYRAALIHQDFRDELEKYICGVFSNRNQKVLAISCMPDHVHILYSHRLSYHIPELIKEVKTASTHFIRENAWLKKPFQWQNGYGIFSCWPDDLSDIIRYIRNQEQHHAHSDFLNEYRKILVKNEVDFSDAYIFKELED